MTRRFALACLGALLLVLPGCASRTSAPRADVAGADASGADARGADARGVIVAEFADGDLPLTADPASPHWAGAQPVVADRDYLGAPIAGRPTEIRARWTRTHLYLLYTCPYDALHLKPEADLSKETPRLWNWDVAEAFIGWDTANIGRYKEFQVSPRGEWVDLDIDRTDTAAQQGMAWDSGFLVKARIDEAARVWYGEMKIPFAAIDPRGPEKGRTLRAGLYRIAGPEPRTFYAWQPTGQRNYHVPEAFGTLRLQ